MPTQLLAHTCTYIQKRKEKENQWPHPNTAPHDHTGNLCIKVQVTTAVLSIALADIVIA